MQWGVGRIQVKSMAQRSTFTDTVMIVVLGGLLVAFLDWIQVVCFFFVFFLISVFISVNQAALWGCVSRDLLNWRFCRFHGNPRGLCGPAVQPTGAGAAGTKGSC